MCAGGAKSMNETQEFIAKFLAHLKRAETMLDYFDDALDKAVAAVETEQHSTSDMRARFQFVLCVFPSAPIADIAACLAGGGLVFAVLATPAQLIAAATIRTKSISGVQVLSCSQTNAIVRYTGGAEIEIPNPAKAIIMVALFWVV